jgi:FKBP-type peptidyl-prolyl cis-trans isomerase FklB
MPSCLRKSHRAVLGSLASLLLLAACTRKEVEAHPPDDGITVSYRLDPRVADSTHGGNRWVSPPVYVGANAQDRVEAMAEAIDAKGNVSPLRPIWTASDPEMVQVGPQGSQVTLLVKRTGESTVTVSAGARSTELRVQAIMRGGFLHLAISQPRAKLVPPATAEAEKKPAPVVSPSPEDVAAVHEKAMKAREARLAAFHQQKEVTEQRVTQLDGVDGMVTLPSGLKYREVAPGQGPRATARDRVRCRIRVTDLSGLQSPQSGGQVVTLAVASDPMLGEALQRMSVGSKLQILMPSKTVSRESARRGKRARAPLGTAYSVPLLYEVELLAINPAKTASTGGGETHSL